MISLPNFGPPPLFSRYVRERPAPANAFSVFGGSWVTQVAGMPAGHRTLMDDERLAWLIDKAGGVDGARVLELGSFEGAHTAMLESHGADVTALEGNVGSFLRSLVLKNHLGLRSNFLLGDFTAFLDDPGASYDYVLASGVLYHMSDPVGLLDRIARATDRFGLWTQVYDETVPTRGLHARLMIDRTPEIVDDGGHPVRLYKHRYILPWMRGFVWVTGFLGGPETYAYWMPLEDIEAVLRRRGFALTVRHDETPQGPAALIDARRV